MPSDIASIAATSPLLPSKPPVKNDAALTHAAQEYEALFLTEMIKPMFETIEIDDEFGGGKGEEVFRGIMIDEYGKLMSRQGGIGLASHIKEALLRAQEAGQSTPHPTQPTPAIEEAYR